MKNTLETRLGLFAALVVISAFFLLTIVGGFEKFQQGQRLHALFDSAHELKVGDRVKMAGVEIGRVERIAIADNKVKVTMRLQADVAVKTDSVATINFAGLMGQNFVAIDFGSAAERLTADQFVKTVEQPDLNSIMARLDNVASGIENLIGSFSGEKIENLIGPFTDFLRQNSGPLSDTIANIRNVTGQISAGQGTMGRLIFEDDFYTSALITVSNLQTATSDIEQLLGDARQTIANVNAGKGSIGLMLRDESLYREATASMTNLREILEKINQGQGTVGKLVNDQDFYKNAKLTLQKVDKATESLEDQGPLSVIGILAGSLF